MPGDYVWWNGVWLPFTSDAPPPALLFPTEANTGLPAGWEPAQTITTGIAHSTPGQVVEDLEIIGTGSGTVALEVRADDVTYRRCRFVDCWSDVGIWSPSYANVFGTQYIDCEFVKTVRAAGPGRQASAIGGIVDGLISNCVIKGWSEGIQFSSPEDAEDVGNLRVEHNWVWIDEPVDPTDWHGDCLQLTPSGAGEMNIDLYNNSMFIDSVAAPGGVNSCIFTQNQTGTFNADRTLVSGGIVPMWLDRGDSITNMYVVSGSYIGSVPFDATTGPSEFSGWLCTLDGNGQPIPGTPIVL